MKTHRIAVLVATAVVAVAAGCDGNASRRGRGISLEDPTVEQQQTLAEASAAKSEGNYETALAMFREVLAENPTVVPAYLGIGDIYMVQKDFEKAEPAYGRAARLDPRNFDAQYGHGLALQMLNRFVEALRAYNRALAINPDSADTNLNIATTYLQLNQARTALTHAQMAVLLDPSNGPARVNLGVVLEKMGRNTDAIEAYLAASELMEPTPELMLNLINVLAREKRYQEAVNTAENLVRLEPSANAFERLGWGYFRLGDYVRSVDAYRKAVDLDPQHWPSWNGIGVNSLNAWLLSRRTDTDASAEARKAFRRSLRLNPDQTKVITLMSNYDL